MTVKTVSLFFIMLLTACNNDYRYKYQINGNEEYLKAPSLRVLNSPSGIILPRQNRNYEIPTILHHGAIGKEINIWPPQTIENIDKLSRQ